MFCLRPTASTMAVLTLLATSPGADDARRPEPVRMIEQPLTAEAARAAQRAWADHLGVEPILENGIGMELCVIPPGTWRMSPTSRIGEGESREATLGQPSFVGRYEVTRDEWERVMGPLRPGQRENGDGRFPIAGVDYLETAAFCRKLTQLEREAGELPEGYEYRMPTVAELEFACRAGTLTETYFGDRMSSRQANFDGENHPFNGAEPGPYLRRATRVGSYPANAWGLHDTHGNVTEWCLDWYHTRVTGGTDPVRLLPMPEHLVPQRVAKGGSFHGKGRYCLSSNRYHVRPDDGSNTTGARVVLSKLHLKGLDRITDVEQTDFDQAWTRDGTNVRIWNRRNSGAKGFHVMSGNIDHVPGTKFAVPISDRSHHTWAHTCLTDGRILVTADPPNAEPGYFLMTPNERGTSIYERIRCGLARKGTLDRISLSPSETRVCFEFRAGFEKDVPGRTLYVADFDAEQLAITGAEPIANEDAEPVWYAFPRWTKDASAIVYQAEGSLHRYDLADGATTRVWTQGDPWPRVERAPK